MVAGHPHPHTPTQCGLFLYDVFWVFGTDVMVTVAKNFDAPIKLLFVRSFATEDTDATYSMLGLGDIVIPGAGVSPPPPPERASNIAIACRACRHLHRAAAPLRRAPRGPQRVGVQVHPGGLPQAVLQRLGCRLCGRAVRDTVCDVHVRACPGAWGHGRAGRGREGDPVPPTAGSPRCCTLSLRACCAPCALASCWAICAACSRTRRKRAGRRVGSGRRLTE